MANQYYDFNPSATTWALLLSVMVVFVLALSVLLIAMIYRAEARSVVRTAAERTGTLTGTKPTSVRTLDHPTAKAS